MLITSNSIDLLQRDLACEDVFRNQYAISFFYILSVTIFFLCRGSATSLFAAIQYPKYIRAVILIRPPTAWKERADRRKYLLGSAEKLRIKEMEKDPPTTYHEVLLSTSMSDLPPKDDLDSYNAIKCPVLILTIEGDDAHPVSTAVTLHSLLKTSTLEVASSQEEALKVWPDIIRKFITEINLL